MLCQKHKVPQKEFRWETWIWNFQVSPLILGLCLLFDKRFSFDQEKLENMSYFFLLENNDKVLKTEYFC